MSGRTFAKLIAALAVVIATIGIVLGLWLNTGNESGSDDDRPATAGGGSSASPLHVAMSDNEAKDLEDGLVSNYRPTLNDVLADGYKPPLAESGTVVKIDRDSLRQYKSAGQVRATVTVPGGKPVVVMLYMERIESDWRVRRVEEVK